MAFSTKFGSLLRQTITKHVGLNGSASMPSIYNAVRSMSSSKLFVGGLNYLMDDQALREAFTSFGDIIEARVIVDRESGRSRGFGFVSFTSGEEASAAMSSMDGQELQGRIIRVNYATERTGGYRGGYGGGGYGGGGGFGGGGYEGGSSGGYGGGGYGGGSGGGGYEGGSSGGYGGGSAGYEGASSGGYGGGGYEEGNSGGYEGGSGGAGRFDSGSDDVGGERLDAGSYDAGGGYEDKSTDKSSHNYGNDDGDDFAGNSGKGY